jgi:hypothetical protein
MKFLTGSTACAPCSKFRIAMQSKFLLEKQSGPGFAAFGKGVLPSHNEYARDNFTRNCSSEGTRGPPTLEVQAALRDVWPLAHRSHSQN